MGYRTSSQFLMDTLLCTSLTRKCTVWTKKIWKHLPFKEEPTLKVFSFIISVHQNQNCSIQNSLSVISFIFINKFVQKCHYSYTLLDKSIPLVTVMSVVSSLTEQLCSKSILIRKQYVSCNFDQFLCTDTTRQKRWLINLAHF